MPIAAVASVGAVVVFVAENLVLVSVTAGVLAVAGLAFMRLLHRRVIVEHPVLSPFFVSQLRAQGLKPIPGTVRVALPAAEPAPAPWRVVSIEKVPRPDGGPLGVARGASEVGMNAPPTHGW